MTATLELVLKNDMTEHARLAEALTAFAEAEGIDPGLATTFELAFDEILANICSYAYDDAEEHAIRVVCRWDGSTLSAEVIDDGRPFDPLKEVPEPDLESGLDEREAGGLGLFLVRQLMDQVAYRREAGHNHLSFAKQQDQD